MTRWLPIARPQATCPHRRLARLLAAALPDADLHPGSTLRPWASANFVGARHLFRATLRNDPPTEALQERLNDTIWSIPGHIVADIVVAPGEKAAAIAIEILTVED